MDNHDVDMGKHDAGDGTRDDTKVDTNDDTDNIHVHVHAPVRAMGHIHNRALAVRIPGRNRLEFPLPHPVETYLHSPD